jgi:hypothetical protein
VAADHPAVRCLNVLRQFPGVDRASVHNVRAAAM